MLNILTVEMFVSLKTQFQNMYLQSFGLCFGYFLIELLLDKTVWLMADVVLVWICG